VVSNVWLQLQQYRQQQQQQQSDAMSALDQVLLQGVDMPSDTNPFEDLNVPLFPCGSARSRYELLKFIVFFPVFIIRVVTATLVLLVLVFIAVIATCCVPLDSEDGCVGHKYPLPPWRIKMISAVAMPCIRILLFLFGFFVEVDDRSGGETRCKEGKTSALISTDAEEGQPTAPKLVVAAPHLTNINILMLCYALPPFMSGVGDVNILKAPFVRSVAIALQGIFVDLKSKESNQACIKKIRERASPSWKGPHLLVFPEGRITNGKTLIQFKQGAFEPLQPVQPVVLRYPHKYFDPTGQSFANRSRLWVFRAFTQVYNSCIVTVLPSERPLPNETPEQFADRVRHKMAEALGVRTTEHSYADANLFREAMVHNVIPDFEVETMKKHFHVDKDEILSWLKLMQKYDTDHNGVVNESEFENLMQNLGHHTQNGVRELFRFLDTDRSGQLEYHEVVQLFALLSRGAQVDQRALLAWHILYSKRNEKTSVPGLEDAGNIHYNTFLKKVQADPQILEHVFCPLQGPMRIQCRLRWSWRDADSFSPDMGAEELATDLDKQSRQDAKGPAIRVVCIKAKAEQFPQDFANTAQASAYVREWALAQR